MPWSHETVLPPSFNVCLVSAQCGSRSVFHGSYDRLILPHKLSIVLNRRKCTDTSDPGCSIGRPPMADYPQYSSATTPYSDLLNLDIKVPAEHTIEGVAFDAEIQMHRLLKK